MLKVVSYGLWGDGPQDPAKYMAGAIRNAETITRLLPGWEAWFYVGGGVPPELIDRLEHFAHVRLIKMPPNDPRARTWRFRPIDDPTVGILCSRDVDSEISPREIAAVNEWLESDKCFHIMRDHTDHYGKILAGMFGVRKPNPIANWTESINAYPCLPDERHGVDESWLKDVVYPLVKDQAVIHDEFNRYETMRRPFPVPRSPELEFVGESLNADGKPCYPVFVKSTRKRKAYRRSRSRRRANFANNHIDQD